jgi:diketogulonate reductase-like aldo/keto reductase
VGLGSTKPVLEILTEGMEPIRSVLRALLAGGGRIVDTAPRTEAIDAEFGGILGEPWLAQMFLATKINATGRDAGVEQMRQTQRLFQRRQMDLVQIESLTDLTTQWTNLRDWKETGEARYIGVTVSSDELHERLAGFMQRESPDFVHVNYSVMETAAEDRILPLAQDLRIAVLTNRPFMNGSYFGRVRGQPLPEWVGAFDCRSWAQFSLKYILAHPAVTCALAETTNPQHMSENLEAGIGRLPSPDQKRRMRALIGAM